MNRLRNPLLTHALGLLMAAVVLAEMISPAAEQMRMTTFAQWLDRSMPSDHLVFGERDGEPSIELLQRWLSDTHPETPVATNHTDSELPKSTESWPGTGWILQAWNDYNEMTDGMKATLSDRLAGGAALILQKSSPATIVSTLRHGQSQSPSRSLTPELRSLISSLRLPFLSGVSINAP